MDDDNLDYLSPSFKKKEKPAPAVQAKQIAVPAAAQAEQDAAAAAAAAAAAPVPAAAAVQAEPPTPSDQADADEGLNYLRRGKPPKDFTKLIEKAKHEANLWAGGELGAVAGAAGPIARGIGSFVEEKGADVLAKALSRVPGLADRLNALNTLNTSGEDLTSGEKWAGKTGFGAGKGTVQQVSSKYNRLKSKGPVSGRLDKLYGPKLPGEPDSLIDRMLLRSQNAEAANEAARSAALAEEEAARSAALAEEPSFGKVIGSGAKNVGNLFGSLAYGALHGMNLANQAQEAMNTWGTNTAEALGHAASGLGSAADLASNFMPEMLRQGVRKYVSPLSMVGAGAADVAKGYGEATEPAQPTETQSDYAKRVMTGQLRMPSAVAKTAMGVVNPLVGFASMAPPLSLDYAMENPEQVRQWAALGIYDNPDAIKMGLQSPSSQRARYARQIGAGRGLVNR
jgi:hypothetical protein